jgi:hypothetical protein
MTSLDEYARQSDFSDPGRYAPLLDGLPTDVRELATVVRNVIVHYFGAGLTFTGDRLAEIDNRWVERILETDQRRHTAPLPAPRPETERVAGCCRDFTLLTVAALRHQGVPARSRIGFAGYFGPDVHPDHVVAEYWNGQRWVYLDAQVDPADQPFDPGDLDRPVGAQPEPPSMFATAAQAWSAYRDGADVTNFGVAWAEPDSADRTGPPLRGPVFVGGSVLLELAHRQRDEVLLWDVWGERLQPSHRADALVDEVADLLLAADEGDEGAERELTDRYRTDPRLRVGATVRCVSPSGTDCVVDLRSRVAVG